MPRVRFRLASLPSVTAAYIALSLVMTWPLARGLARDLPADLGDPLLNCYILDWTSNRLARLVRGDWRALQGFWSPGLFHPEPLTLAYSDHLIAQAIQILPVYTLMDNLILAYNVLFLSTFVFAGLGTFLLVRELTGSVRAAFLAGLVYAFAPYRFAQLPHLQILSSHWTPFALAALRRFFDTRRKTALVAAGAALVAQNLSSGYLMLMLAPIAVAYSLYEVSARGLLRDRPTWTALGTTFAAVALATAPFVWPYLEARAAGVPPRSLEEVRFYSADLLSYLTASPSLRLWGPVMQGFPKPEGELFPGATPLVFAAVALGAGLSAGWRRAQKLPRPGRLCRILAGISLVVTVLYAIAFGAALWTDRLDFGIVTIRVRGKWRLLLTTVAAATTLLALSRRVRALLAGELQRGTLFFAAGLAVAATLSFGPALLVGGEVRLDPAPYRWLYDYLPGFDGLRVPARFGMAVALALAVLTGLGAAAIEQRRRRAARVLVLVGGVTFLAEATAIPIPLNVTVEVDGYATPPRVAPAREAPPVHRFLRTLPAEAVVAEFPFGIDAYELRYLYWATVHGRRLVNGYSGYFPPSYHRRRSLFRAAMDHGDEAWRELLAAGTTHLVVHEGAYRDDHGRRLVAWLEARGARELARFGQDRVFELPPGLP